MPFFPAIQVFARLTIAPFPRANLMEVVGKKLGIPYSVIRDTAYPIREKEPYRALLRKIGWKGGPCMAVQLDEIPKSATPSPWNTFLDILDQEAATAIRAEQAVGQKMQTMVDAVAVI